MSDTDGDGVHDTARDPHRDTARDAARPPLLELIDVRAAYGPFRALFGVSLTVRDAKTDRPSGAWAMPS